MLEAKFSIRDLKAVERIHSAKPAAADFVAPANQRLNEIFLRLGIAELTGLHDRADVVVGKRHDDLCSPVAVVFLQVGERGIWILGLPGFGLKVVRFDSPD